MVCLCSYVFLRVYQIGRKIKLSLRTTVRLQKYRKCLCLTFIHNQKILWQCLFVQPLTPSQECFGALAFPEVWGQVRNMSRQAGDTFSIAHLPCVNGFSSTLRSKEMEMSVGAVMAPNTVLGPHHGGLPLSLCKTLHLLKLWLLYHLVSLPLSLHGQKMEPEFRIQTLEQLNSV